jgi:hypothetical protein
MESASPDQRMAGNRLILVIDGRFRPFAAVPDKFKYKCLPRFQPSPDVPGGEKAVMLI